MKSKSLILMVLSLGFGLVAAIGINQIMKSNQANAKQPVQKMGPVVVAADHLDLYTHLSEENVELENWPLAIIPPDALTSLEQIVDQATTVRMSKGMPIIATTLKHKNKVNSITIPHGMKVVAVRVSSEHTIGNLLNPGDKVDVIGIFKRRDPRNNRTTTISKTFLKALKVFSINDKTNAGERGEGGGRAGSTIVGLLVTEKQSEQLVFAQGTGTIKLVLRGDDSPGDDNLDDLDDIMEGMKSKFEDSNNPHTVQPAGPSHTMVLMKGQSMEKMFFGEDGSPEDGVKMNDKYQAPKPGSYSPPTNQDGGPSRGDAPDRGKSKDNGSESNSGSSDNDRNIDDDQYRGE